MDKVKTRKVERSLYVNYLKRAGECLNAAKQSFAASEWNASAICAIHCCIAALDALCVYFLGQRHAGQNHDDALSLFHGIKQLSREETNKITNMVSRTLSMKNIAEYEERLVYRSEAEKALKNAERLLESAKNKLSK